MRTNRLRDLLASGETVVSAWMSIGSPYLAEVLSHCGYDTVTVDLQHGMFDLETAVTLLQAVGAGPATPMARCPSKDPAVIGKLLDAGAYGIVCPNINSADEALAFVSACRYPPQGERSFGPARGLLYGGPDYLEHADSTILTWAMIESASGLENLDTILATPGLDGVYVGPNDLALSLGEPPAAGATPGRTAEALAHVARAARGAGRWAGVFCADSAIALHMIELGYDLVTPGNDVGVMRQAAHERIATVRGRGGPSRRGGDS